MQLDLARLRVLRAEQNWTQEELARRASISQNAYLNIEHGTQFPKYV